MLYKTPCSSQQFLALPLTYATYCYLWGYNDTGALQEHYCEIMDSNTFREAAMAAIDDCGSFSLPHVPVSHFD